MKFTATFDVETLASDQAEVRSLFRTDQVNLTLGAVVTFKGEVTPGVQVTLSGE